MTLVHILTRGFDTPNGRAFLFPILYHQHALLDLGIRCRVFFGVEDGLTDCDALFVDGKFYRSLWASDRSDVILEQLDGFRSRAGKLVYFDTTDSTGNLQTEVLPYVDRYYKGQLLKDRSLYRDTWYGARIYTDYYHRVYGVEDDEQRYSKPVPSDADLNKLGVSWSVALADYSYSLVGGFLNRLYRLVGRDSPMRLPKRWCVPSSERRVDVSARFSVSQGRATVRFQRQRVQEILDGKVQTSLLRRRAYFREMEQSKIVIAPFAWGEFNMRDLEAFLSGCVLVKPDMSHLETWPDLYQDGTTMLSFDWDMEGLLDLVERVLENYAEYLPVAVCGQETYRTCLVGEPASEMFARRFQKISQET